MAVRAILRVGDELARRDGAAGRHEILEGVVGRQLAGRPRQVDRDAHAMRERRLVGDGNRARDRREVRGGGVAVHAVAEFLPARSRARLGVRLDRARERRHEARSRVARRRVAVDVALPARRQPAGRRHELGDAEAQGRGGQFQHRPAVRSLDRQLDHCAVVRNLSAVDGCDESTDRLDLLGRQGRAIADGDGSAILDVDGGGHCRSGGAGRTDRVGWIGRVGTVPCRCHPRNPTGRSSRRARASAISGTRDRVIPRVPAIFMEDSQTRSQTHLSTRLDQFRPAGDTGGPGG